MSLFLPMEVAIVEVDEDRIQQCLEAEREYAEELYRVKEDLFYRLSVIDCEWERELSELGQGTPFPGLLSLITTGHVDKATGHPCDPLS